MKDNRPIGIFDSGMGGLSVLKLAAQELPNEDFVFFGDNEYAPYGIKSDEDVLHRCEYICDLLINKYNCKAIVIACNTATSVSIERLRTKYAIPIIGMEPAVNLACKNKNDNTIISIATPLTLSRERYKKMCQKLSEKNTIISIPTPELVSIVENDQLSDVIIKKQFDIYFKDIDMNHINSIVLGCTHFTYYKKWLKNKYPNINIIDGNNGTINQLKSKIKKAENDGNIEFLSSNPNKLPLMKKLFNSNYI